MRPAVPVPGVPIDAAWAGDMIDYAGSRWRYVPLETVTGVVSRTYPNNVTRELELTELPANDPTVVAAHVHAMVRETSTASRVLQLHDGRNQSSRVGFVGTSGYASRGNGGTGFIVPVGGTNGRSIAIYGSTSATATCWVTVLGYWVVESDEPASGQAGAVDADLPADPVPGSPMKASWAKSMVAMVGKGWAYHPFGYEVNGTARSATGTYYEAVPSDIPDGAVAASCFLRIRGSTTSSIAGLALDSDGNVAGIAYTTGVVLTYGVSGFFPLFIDAARQYGLNLNGDVNDFIAVFTGYWTKDS